MHLEIIADEAGFDALADDWDRLAGASPFSHRAWSRAWWRAYGDGGRLSIRVVRDADRVLAVAPWYLGRRRGIVRTLQFLANDKACTDYQRVLVDRDLAAADRRRVFDLLAASCLDGRAEPCDLVELDGVVTTDPDVAEMLDALQRAGFRQRHEALESSWIVSLPPRFDDFVAASPRGLRRKINKARRRATEPDVVFHHADDPATIAAAWPEFVRLHRLRFTHKVDDGGCFNEPRFERFLQPAVQAFAERGEAELVWCAVRGQPISMQLYFFHDDTAFMYQSGFDPAFAPYEPGHLLYTYVVESLIRRGVTKLDFLRGNESYKADWNARPTALTRVQCASPRAISRLRCGVVDFALLARRKLRDWGTKPNAAAPTPSSRTDAPHVEVEEPLAV
jgi:CelD/BcsL family acetyltransferase involved in cellulose biosynthesis